MQRLWMNVRQLLRSDHYRYSLVYWMIWVWLFLSLQLVVSANALAQSQSANPLREASSESSEKSVGSIRNFTGLVSLQSAEGKNKIANVGTRLFVGDIINTQKDSTVVLVFVDKTQVALRPKTRFVVEEYAYQPDNPIADKADFKLVQGGLRTLTGLIGKRSNTDAFQMRSQTATIGIRGTDFSARVCQGDECKRLASSEKGSASETNNSTVGAAGRVSQVMGQVSAINPAGQTRQLERGAAVFSGDKLTVNKAGFAVLVMADSSRMTLPGGSELEIAAFNYEPTEPKASVASFKLLAGGLRSVTGAIGKNQPDNVKFATQTATIGIRGTEINFGIVPPGAPPPALPGDVVLQVISGNVLLTNAAGQSVALLAGQFATVSGTNFPQVLTNAINIQQLILAHRLRLSQVRLPIRLKVYPPPRRKIYPLQDKENNQIKVFWWLCMMVKL